MLGHHRGHIRATNDQIAADNTGHQRSSILTAQQLTSASITGRRIIPVLSRTEEPSSTLALGVPPAAAVLGRQTGYTGYIGG
jgi:hypothetical protein